MNHQVYVHMGEPACRDWYGVEWSCWLLEDLSTLVLPAGAAHSCHVFVDALPDKMGSHHMLGGKYARVGHTGEAWKNCRSVRGGTRGLVMAHPTSHSRVAPSTWTVLTVLEEDCVLGQLAWLVAILENEIPCSWLHVSHASCHGRK
jgi:hypothetical protein